MKNENQPDRVIGRITATRAEIVERMKSAGVVCDACAGPRLSDLVEPARIDLMASEMPNVALNVVSLRLVRCVRCNRPWNPFKREWVDEPAGIEDRK